MKSDAWNEYDRGELTGEESIRKFIENDPEMEADIRRCLSDVAGMVVRNDYAIPWIQKLKEKSYRCLYLSNFSKSSHVQCAAALDFLPYMDGGILSYEDKVIKPMPEIYRLLIDRYGLTPGECVFLDDTKRNLDAAEKFGIHTIHFQNQEQAIEELRKLGVEA